MCEEVLPFVCPEIYYLLNLLAIFELGRGRKSYLRLLFLTHAILVQRLRLADSNLLCCLPALPEVFLQINSSLGRGGEICKFPVLSFLEDWTCKKIASEISHWLVKTGVPKIVISPLSSSNIVLVIFPAGVLPLRSSDLEPCFLQKGLFSKNFREEVASKLGSLPPCSHLIWHRFKTRHQTNT